MCVCVCVCKSAKVLDNTVLCHTFQHVLLEVQVLQILVLAKATDRACVCVQIRISNCRVVCAYICNTVYLLIVL